MEVVNASSLNIETGVFVPILAIMAWLPKYKAKIAVDMNILMKITLGFLIIYSWFLIIWGIVARFT